MNNDPSIVVLRVTILRTTPETSIVATQNGIPVVIGTIPKLPVAAVRDSVIDRIEGMITAAGGESAEVGEHESAHP